MTPEAVELALREASATVFVTVDGEYASSGESGGSASRFCLIHLDLKDLQCLQRFDTMRAIA